MGGVGIAFYTREAYKILLETAVDRKALHDNYEDWKKEFEKAFNGLSNEGMDVHPFPMNMVELLRWCAEQGLPNTSANRAKFVAAKGSES